MQRSFWIFDLDGTLTVPVHDFVAIKNELGLDPNSDILSSLAALSESERAAKNQVLMEIEVDLAKNAEAAVGGERLLNALQQRNCTLGILTRNAMECVWLSLRAIGLQGYFSPHSIIGRDEAKPKPDPDGIFKGNGLSVLKDMMAGVTADKVMMGATEPIAGDVHKWYEEHFAGRLKHLLTVCVWVGQVNFFDHSAANL